MNDVNTYTLVSIGWGSILVTILNIILIGLIIWLVYWLIARRRSK